MTTKKRQSWGSVRRLPSGRFQASYRHDGQAFNAPTTFATKTDANLWLASERADRARGTWTDPNAGNDTLADYAEQWLAHRADLSPRTRDLYVRQLRRWVAARIAPAGLRAIDLGAMPMKSLTPEVVRRWYAAVRAQAEHDARSRAERPRTRGPRPERAWAIAQGYEVAPTGRLSPVIVEAWKAAGSPVPPRRESTGEPGRAQAVGAYRLLHAILATAVDDGQLPSNPARIAGAGQYHAPERPVASPAEVGALAALMPAHLSAAVPLAAWSGLRYGELFALARRHVDLDAGTVRVERALETVPGQPIRFGKTKTRRSLRTVHLPALVVDALREHMDEHTGSGPDALVFTTTRGLPVDKSSLGKAFRRARAKLGRDDLRWHDLRHTGATLAYAAGASVADVQGRLGHATVAAAMVYAHRGEGADKALADRLDALARA